MAHAAGLLTPEVAILGGLMPLALGETDFGSLKDLLQKQGEAFDEFKKDNDARLQAKADGKSVEAYEAKLSKSNDELSKLSDLKSAVESIEKKMGRPGATGDVDPDKAEHKAAFGKFLRKGVEDGLGELQQKAYNITTDADGGYAVPEELDRDILTLMRDTSPMREVCNVVTVGGSEYKKLANKGGTDIVFPLQLLGQVLYTCIIGYIYPYCRQNVQEVQSSICLHDLWGCPICYSVHVIV